MSKKLRKRKLKYRVLSTPQLAKLIEKNLETISGTNPLPALPSEASAYPKVINIVNFQIWKDDRSDEDVYDVIPYKMEVLHLTKPINEDWEWHLDKGMTALIRKLSLRSSDG